MSRPIPLNQRGFSLIELLVSLVIGLFMIAGAIYVYSASSKSYAVHETTNRLEEAGRYALSLIEPDVRESGYWGLTKGSVSIGGGYSQLAGSTNASSTLGVAVSQCGLNFGADVSTAVEGTNDRYLANAAAGCAPFTTAMPSSDTLTVRHSTVTTATAAGITGTGPLYVCSTLTSATLVNTTTACTLQTITQATVPTVTMKGGIYNLVVNTYYVNQDAATTPGLPTLYRQTLSNTSGAAPSIVNTEILPGVEDLQVQFGIDPTGTTGVASQYVDAVTAQQLSAGAATAVAQVVSVRIWLLLRADQAEPTFTDSNTYQYANRTTANGTVTTLTASNAGKAYAPADHYRRLLVSRTIMLRNALGT